MSKRYVVQCVKDYPHVAGTLGLGISEQPFTTGSFVTPDGEPSRDITDAYVYTEGLDDFQPDPKMTPTDAFERCYVQIVFDKFWGMTDAKR